MSRSTPRTAAAPSPLRASNDPRQREPRSTAGGTASSPATAQPEALENFTLAMSGALMLGAPFLQPALSWLHWIALVPWIILATRDAGRARWYASTIAAYAFAIMAWGPYSIFSRVVPFALGALVAVFIVPFVPLLRLAYTRTRLPLTLVVPVVWVTLEWIRTRFAATALFPVGAMQFEHLRLIQVADIGGVSLVSFLVACVNGALAEMYIKRRRGWRQLRFALLAPALLIVAVLYGEYRLGQTNFVSGPRIAVVQPNELHSRNPAKAREIFARQVAFTRDEVPAGSTDLIVWPENAVDGILAGDSAYMQGLTELAREKGASVVTGAYSVATTRPFFHTSAYQLSPAGDVTGVYHKLYLIPESEYLPLEHGFMRSFTALHRLHRTVLQRVTGFVGMGIPGTELVTFTAGTSGNTFRFATPICFEIVNNNFGRDAASKGADFLVNITSEGALGPAVYIQTWAFGRFRAVENRIGVVRAGNNGMSGFIDPNGRTQRLVRGKQTGKPYLDNGVVIDRVQVDRLRRTFYTRFGDVFAYLCLAGTLGVVGLAWFVSRRESHSIAAGT